MDREQQDLSTEINHTEAMDHSASDNYVGRWNRLISTTNWEKGRIIHEWRAHLMASNAPATEYSDDAWSRMVGSVSGQHVGRLRRVYERFGDVFTQYDGLFWSHFQSALDWDDAEMWLEGAIQNKWSVAIMRRNRWETLGSIKADEPQDQDVVVADVDEDVAELPSASGDESARSEMVADDYMSEARSPAGPDFGDEDDTHRMSADSTSSAVEQQVDAAEAIDPPFADVPNLPEDLAAAVEAFQLAIIRHKSEEWRDVSSGDVLATLDALKSLVLAPT